MPLLFEEAKVNLPDEDNKTKYETMYDVCPNCMRVQKLKKLPSGFWYCIICGKEIINEDRSPDNVEVLS